MREPATGPVVRLGDDSPRIHGTAWVAPTASVIGRVTLGAESSVWYSTVVRADLETIEIGAGSNVQDGCVLHADPGRPVRVGERVTIGHRAVLHGATVEDDVLIGMGSVVLNGAHIGNGSVVGAGAVVTENTRVPPGSLVLGTPAAVRGEIGEEQRHGIVANAAHYVALAARHRADATTEPPPA
jgi:carbonic anhydrase/acetyltransferase-like protein (isoleucine patch superfamily)